MNLTDQTVMRSCYKPGKILHNALWEPRGGNERRPKGDSFANKERSAEKKKYSFIRP